MLSLITTLMAASALAQPVSDWQETIDEVVPGVVAIRVNSPRAFDSEVPGYLQATGFVVDAEQGLILTNRHVVRSGPVRAEAVLLDHEEVPVEAVYRDPVHDFGFYRFDPADVEFMELPELALAPQNARLGREIRVIGNDAGEKLSILPGTIARLDRRAPDYGPSTWNDFNTFYIQAASGTSGGSSGSPVVDIEGKVVALNAGGSLAAASSFFLPLERVERALEKLQKGEEVERGTLQTLFVYEPYDEVRRLGVRRETEAASRSAFPDSTGMLVVGQVVPGGPAAGLLEPGDVVVKLNGDRLGDFIGLESVLDDSVGERVTMDIERGGEMRRVELEVEDLHAITPDRYLEFGGGALNPLSYHQARNHSIPVEGVYLASPGYVFSRAGIPRGVVITEVGGVKVPDLESFETEMARYADGEKVPLQFFSPVNPRTPSVRVVRADRTWFPMQMCRRDDSTGRWPCVASPSPRTAPPAQPASTDMVIKGAEDPVKTIGPSIVQVSYDVPYRLDGVHGDRFTGAGLVVDTESGLVVVDRETVPIALGDLSIVFGGSVEVPAEVAYLHPEHNFAVIQYDPSLLGETGVRAARFSDVELEPGDDVWFVGITGGQRIVSRETRVSRREPVSLAQTFPPRFRDRNIEVVSLDDVMATVGGVLVDEDGRVQALWASFSAGDGGRRDSFFGGIPARSLRPVVDRLKAGEAVAWRSLGAEFIPLALSQARGRGLSDEQARRLEKADPEGRRVLMVRQVDTEPQSSQSLYPGDLLLSVNGKTVTRHHEIEQASMEEEVRLEVLRNGEKRDLVVRTEPRDGTGTGRALLWAGTLLQDAPDVLAREYGISPTGVYVARYRFGSPANRYGLVATTRIVEVDGHPTPDLDAFIEAMGTRSDRDSVRLKTIDLDGRTSVTTLKLDLEYWPTAEVRQTADGWRVKPIGEATSAPGPESSSGQVLDHQGGDSQEGKESKGIGKEGHEDA